MGLLSISELQDSLKKAHDTAAGPDDIHYQLLKHLLFEALRTLLSFSTPSGTADYFRRHGEKLQLPMFLNQVKITQNLPTIVPLR